MTESASYEEDEDICAIPRVNFNSKKSNGNIKSELDPIMKVPPDDSSFDNFYLKEILMNGKFVSFSNHKKKSVLHLKAIERKRVFIGNLTPKDLLSYMLPPQEAPRKEHHIELTPMSIMCLMIMALVQPAVRKELPPLEFSSNKVSLDQKAEVLKSYD